ncbi:MAG: helicase C-terminal domain-containing protein [Myxococcota bacterium]|nr:helicase C-terminal domain-containing protein [Myxococcota bacterium]
MGDEERAALVGRLSDPGSVKVLHAVLGGIFAEGIDLPGGVLKAVVVVGPALPPVGLERDLIRKWCEERYGQGFAYAFLVPGMSKVVQAAGRVVRGPTERGLVALLGRRFGWRDYRALLPPDWEYELGVDPIIQAHAFFGEE